MTLAKRTADNNLFGAASMPDRSTAQNRSDRRAIKRAFGLPVSVLDYAPAGTTAWETAINEAIVDVGLNADKRLHLPGGNYDVFAPITMAYPIDFYGDGLSKSVLRGKHSGIGVLITGEFGTGLRLRDMTYGFDIAGGNASAHIFVSNFQNVGTPTIHYSPDFMALQGLNLTGYSNSTAGYNIVLDGNSRINDVGGTVPIAIRNISMKNIVGFNALTRALDVRHVRVGYYEDANFYGGAGVGGAAVTAIPGKLSYDNKFFGGSINGTFTLADCDATRLYGVTTTVVTGANVTNHVSL